MAETAVDSGALLAEAYRRGLLTSEQRSAFEEAAKRGMFGQDVLMSAGLGGGPGEPAPRINPTSGQSVAAAPEPAPMWQRFATEVPRTLARGAATALGTPGNLESLGIQYLVNPLNRAMGSPEESPSNTLFPTSQEFLTHLGLNRDIRMEPQGPIERTVMGGVEGLGAALPSLALGAPPVATLSAGAAGGAAGQAAREALPDSTAAPLVAGALAGLGVQGVSSVLSGSASRLERVAAGLGSSETLQEAGNELQDAARAWLTSDRGGRADPDAKRVIGKLLASYNSIEMAPQRPEDVAAKLLSQGKRGGTDLAILRKELPEALNELVAAGVRQNPSLWQKLSPEAKEALVPGADVRKTLDQVTAGPRVQPSPLGHGVESLVGGSLGHGLATLGAYLAGGHIDPYTAGALGDVIGLVTPSVLRGAASVARNPGAMRLPAVGAIAGQNPLYPVPVGGQ